MKMFELCIEQPLEYVMTGKFEAPSEYWIHEDFPLGEYELCIVTEGILYIRYNNEEFKISSGECLLLPPVPPPANRRKGFRPSRCSFYWLHFSCNHDVNLTEISTDELKEFSTHNNNFSLLIPKQAILPNLEKVIVLMKQLQDAVKTKYHPHILNYMTTIILCELHSQLEERYTLDTHNKRTQKQMYYDIIDFIKQNLGYNLKVSDVALHFGYNKKYLSHLFSQIAGIPLKQYILTNKMDQANFLLTDTNKSINEIALSIGFSDSHHFAKAYKKIYGLTPTEYRNAFSKRLLFHV